ncbi:unnamed protein product [Prorocentrum cordatum]|uniref:Mitochondrial import inner membrane translocase subunit TIM50 n=1 Tax=Prorocentrum cordatum TaxID=2364126 RepID=A0ABN9W2C3_9DINO|nr:unnamed protein product [Polarella glacialis]
MYIDHLGLCDVDIHLGLIDGDAAVDKPVGAPAFQQNDNQHIDIDETNLIITIEVIDDLPSICATCSTAELRRALGRNPPRPTALAPGRLRAGRATGRGADLPEQPSCPGGPRRAARPAAGRQPLDEQGTRPKTCALGGGVERRCGSLEHSVTGLVRRWLRQEPLTEQCVPTWDRERNRRPRGPPGADLVGRAVLDVECHERAVPHWVDVSVRHPAADDVAPAAARHAGEAARQNGRNTPGWRFWSLTMERQSQLAELNWSGRRPAPGDGWARSGRLAELLATPTGLGAARRAGGRCVGALEQLARAPFPGTLRGVPGAMAGAGLEGALAGRPRACDYAIVALGVALPGDARYRPPAGASHHSQGPGHERLTVVLDLDETLAHCRLEPARGLRHAFAVEFEETGARGFVYPRPCVGLFLEAAARLFEVVVFTASSQRYADQVLDGLDPSGGRISARLYRHHCTEVGHGYFKDLRRLGRALDRTVLVDDRELMELLLVLQRIAQHGSVPGFLSSRYGLRAFVERLRREPGLLGEPPDGG